MLKTVNELQMAYTHYIEPKLGKIYFMSKSKKVSLEDMKKNIRNYVWNATGYYYVGETKVYTKKKEFLKNIEAMTSKQEISNYCYNAVNKATETIAK